jgi:ketosteroid isomerase-like protein
MKDNEAAAVVLKFFELSAAGDMDACFGLLADDVTWTNIGSTRFSGTYAGKDAVLNDLVGPLFGLLKNGMASTIDRVISEGDTAVVLQRGQAETHEGKAYNNDYAQVFTVRDGRIVAVKEYMDTALVDAVFGPVQ